MRWIGLVGLFLITQVSCISRHPESGYGSFGDESPLMSSLEEQELINDGVDVGNIHQMSPRDRRRLQYRMDLNRMEKSLYSVDEKRQYYRYKDQMRSDRQRIKFLSLPTYQARQNYLQSRGLYVDDSNYSREVASLIADNDITLGMPKSAVRESWGEPRFVEVSGNKALENERWHYTKYVKSIEGYKKEDRMVVFQGGLVAGWDTK